MRVAWLLVLVTSCSFIGTKPPPRSWDVSQPTDCVTSEVSPVLDGLVALGGAVLAGTAIAVLSGATGYEHGCRYAGEEAEKPNHPSCEIVYPALGIGAVAAAGLSYSAWQGVRRNRACKQARATHHEWVVTMPLIALPDAGVPADAPGLTTDAITTDAGLEPDAVNASEGSIP
jgi:hypothetical protein